MELLRRALGRQVLRIVPVNIRYDLIGISCHPDIAYFIDILIRFPKIIGFHSDPGRKYLADVGAVHKSQNFRQFLHGQVGVKQEVDGFSHPHLI